MLHNWHCLCELLIQMEHDLQHLFPIIFDSVNDGVFTVDETFHITSFNAAAERIIGIRRDQAIGRRCHEVFRASICQRGCALRETLASGQPQRDIRIDVLNAEMEVVPIAVSTAVLRDSDDRLVGGVEIFRDVSDLELLRNELEERNRFKNIIGQSRSMQEVFALIPQLAQSDAAVLINGASGTGKELVAQAIHEMSPRADQPFVRVNCGAIPDSLLESELFGHVRGAFTGAIRDKPGRFEQADGGTLFLDEIGDVSPAFQVKLLRALEEGEIQPLGGMKTKKVDVRLISATHRNLAEMVQQEQFRDDLYYRIRVVPVELPLLADRRKDIPLLVDHFVARLATRTGRRRPQLTIKAMRALYDYGYPGNVRELRNIIERAFVLSSGDLIDLHHLPPEIRPEVALDATPDSRSLRPSEQRIFAASIGADTGQAIPPEKTRLLAVLESNNWNRSRTAESLGIGRTTLWRRMKEYGLV